MSASPILLRSTFEELNVSLDAIWDTEHEKSVAARRLEWVSTLQNCTSSDARHLETVFGHLLAFPDEQVLETPETGSAGRQEVAAARAHAEALIPVKGMFAARMSQEAVALLDKHSAGTRLLVCGVYRDTPVDDGGVLTLTDGTPVRVRPGGQAMPASGERVWALIWAQTWGRPRKAYFSLVQWRPYVDPGIYVPRYGDDSRVESYARSCLNALLTRWVELPADVEPLLDRLYAIHTPADTGDVAYGQLPEVRRHVVAQLIGLSDAGPTLPTARLIRNRRDAEEYAAEMMRSLGYADAQPTRLGADGGVDVRSARAIAQVNLQGVETGRPQVQQIAGVARVEGVEALLFSLAGYSLPALEWAQSAGVACFEFMYDGTITPANDAAGTLLRHGAPR